MFMSLTTLLQGLQDAPLSQAIAESAWIFPTVESVHVVAITLVVGSILVVDLRLVGLASPGRLAHDLQRQYLPLTWTAFAIALLTGSTLFLAKPLSYLTNPFFVIKLALLVLAALNMALFHVVVERRRSAGAARVSGLASIAIWIGVVAMGRWIGFTI